MTIDPPIRWQRIAAMFVVMWCVVEVVARGFTFLWADQPYSSFSKYRWSPYGLVRNNPALSMPGYQINANGFRDTIDYTNAKPPHTFRVLMVGGSVLYSPLAGKMVSGVERVDSSSTIAQFFDKELRADPAFAGLHIEVLNAAVNFNKIPEVSTAYLTEYAFWDPDIVVVFGSGNNFADHPRRGEIAAHRFGLEAPHPWRLEFERVANERTFSSLVDHLVSHAEAGLASVAWAKKSGSALIDKVFSISDANALVKRPRLSLDPAPSSEVDIYIGEYLGYLDSMLAVANRRDQVMVVFWEYLLTSLEGIKPMSPPERQLYTKLKAPGSDTDARFDAYAREHITAYLKTRGILLLDPIETLRHADSTVFSDHIHYTRDGNALMAKFVYHELREILHERRSRVR